MRNWLRETTAVGTHHNSLQHGTYNAQVLVIRSLGSLSVLSRM
jgi:hypothetical protein